MKIYTPYSKTSIMKNGKIIEIDQWKQNYFYYIFCCKCFYDNEEQDKTVTENMIDLSESKK